MSLPEKKDFPRLLPDSRRLVSLSMEIGRAASRLESRFWENQLSNVILKLLETKKQHKLDDAIEYLYQADPDAYNILLEAIEAHSESGVMQHKGVDYDVLLVVAPVMAWTRFAIPSGPLSSALHAGLVSSLADCIFAENARFLLAPELYAIDQLPQSHVEVFALMKDMAAPLLGKSQAGQFKSQETTLFLADVRYLVMSVLVPVSQPLFRWQTTARVDEHGMLRKDCLENWKKNALPLLSNMMHGCVLDLTLPDAFFDACRKADQQIRPASIHAAVHYLALAMDVSAADLRAVIGGFVEVPEQVTITEYRIGFSLRDNPQILYGVIWPVYGAEEIQQTVEKGFPSRGRGTPQKEKTAPLDQILVLLETSGIACEKLHLERFPMEFCDECGVPLFADINAELVHAELPESAMPESRLH
ncbi:DUF2863 family protein [Oxalobacter vibrioformis]|uniref:DUF2863 family protein n=1 Tax=Oxalobacter vibrioformis TaxID=933080 RepID=A0A9E9M027_9BURK|nr:DUF2863 family protein [Oxalobacter vibrioformis]WAW10704.1 DUF2863 family protein [Oxalobacter vibrioformis]